MKMKKTRTQLFGLIGICSQLIVACDPSNKVHIGPKMGIKIPIEHQSGDEYYSSTTADKEEAKENQQPKFAQLENQDTNKQIEKGFEHQNFNGTGKFISGRTPNETHQKKAGGAYSLNFDGADIGEVAKIILSDMLEESYIMSPNVGGLVTLQTTSPLHKDELMPTLEMLLRVNGAVLFKRDGIFHIEPDANGPLMAGSNGINNRKLKHGYQIKVIPLHYIGANDMAEILTPIVPNKAIIKIDHARNLLMLAGTRSELRKMLDVIQTFDVNFISGMSFGLYPLENTDVTDTLTEIEQIFNKGEQNPLSGMIRFISIKHLNAILVVTQQKAYLKEAEKWINRLDKESEAIGEGGVIVYRAQHVDAVELASTLSQIVSGVSSSSSRPSVSPGQKVSTITNKNKKANQRTQVSRNLSGKGNASLEGVNIIADEPNNALVITAQPQQYRMLHKIIKQLDVMPLQVLVDATIISVDLTDDLQYGVRWAFENTIDGGFTNLNKGGGVLFGNLVSEVADNIGQAAVSGFTYGVVNNEGTVRMAIDLLAKDTKTDVISSPSVMVLNNHEATLKIGNQVPIRTSQSTNTSGGGNINNLIQTSPIEMRDTGVTLKVKPRVNAKGVVILEVEQNVDNVAQAETNTGSQIDSPTILQRQIKSTVAIESSESVVLGGLINETHTKTNNGIPLLKDIPYLGWLFGSQAKNVVKQELILVITPRVVENKFDARRVTDELKRKLTGIFYNRDKYQPGYGEILRDSSGRVLKE